MVRGGARICLFGGRLASLIGKFCEYTIQVISHQRGDTCRPYHHLTSSSGDFGFPPPQLLYQSFKPPHQGAAAPFIASTAKVWWVAEEHVLSDICQA